MNQEPQANPKKLFIGNLPFSITEDQLKELFSQYGEIVELNLISDRNTGRPKGIAFIEYATEEEAQKAIEGANGTEVEGRAIIVNVARPLRPRTDRPFQGGNRGGYNRRDN